MYKVGSACAKQIGKDGALRRSLLSDVWDLWSSKYFFLTLCGGAIFPSIAESTAPAEGLSNPQGGQSFGRIDETKSHQPSWGQTMVSWRQDWQYPLAIAAPCSELQNAVVDVTPQTNRKLLSGAELKLLHVAHAAEFGFWRGNLLHCTLRS